VNYESLLEKAIINLEKGVASEKEKVAVMANEAVGRLKNGGFTFFYGEDIPGGVSFNEVEAAHISVNPNMKRIYDAFKNELSIGFFYKGSKERYLELESLLDEDGSDKAYNIEIEMFDVVENDFDRIFDFISQARK